MHTRFSVQSYFGKPQFASLEENSKGIRCSKVDFISQNEQNSLEGSILIPRTMLRVFRENVPAEWYFASLDGVWSLVGFKQQDQFHLEILEWRERALNLRKQQSTAATQAFDYLSLWVLPSFLLACAVALFFYRLFPENNVGLGLGLMTFSFVMSGVFVYLNHWGLWKDIPKIVDLEKMIKEKSYLESSVRKVA